MIGEETYGPLCTLAAMVTLADSVGMYAVPLTSGKLVLACDSASPL